MFVLLGTVFVASLLGSLHCVGMCGPFALLAIANQDKRKASLLPSLAYSLGRLGTYSMVGLLFGTLGLALNKTVSFSGYQQTATYFAGLLMISVGSISLAQVAGVKVKFPSMFAPIQKLLQSAFRQARKMRPIQRAFTIGALTSLMPCGWLYTFAITAAGTGSPVWGMLLMAVFWAGTVPILLALTLGLNNIGRQVQAKIPVVMASLVILLGVFTMAWRAPVIVGAETKVESNLETMTQKIISVDQSELPCCSNH